MADSIEFKIHGAIAVIALNITSLAEYSRAKDVMFAHTDIKQAPWYVVEADVKKRARLNCITHFLSQISYEDLTPEPIKLAPRTVSSSYVRPPKEDQNLVPDYYQD